MGLNLPVCLSGTCFLGCTVGLHPASSTQSVFRFWLLTMSRKHTGRLFGTFVALVIMLAGGVLIYTGWQSKPGREEILALGIVMTIGGLILVVWFGR
jgi:hypothetical protein